ncbi:hypothetical protein Cgig2_004623 [Carnegiea gigantea]|uniref:THH1/TOM1/TOM3 domain-containing protein n=1 Tax=Carnegiea gigantea TaxID=171969 RepID=A0A9Q1JYR4_9CARY|nr:hypothetical protein Cgig2_004623 [Carnegiea gigantea]
MVRVALELLASVGFTLSEFKSGWWEEINESTQWQDGIFFALCAAYAVVAVVALIQLVRIELRVPEYGWTTQKVFHLMNFIVNGVRAVVCGFHMFVFALKPKALDRLFPGWGLHGYRAIPVGSVTAICFTCFLVRCVMVVEILPSALVLFILRKLPPRRISAQYHPIR